MLILAYKISCYLSMIISVFVLIAPYFRTHVVYTQRLHIQGAKALALPGVIILVDHGSHNIPIIRHEMVHQEQYKRYTPFGVSVLLGWHYGMGFWKQWRSKQPLSFWLLWSSNPLEIEANKRMYDNSPIGAYNIPEHNEAISWFSIMGWYLLCACACVACVGYTVYQNI